MSTKEKVLKGKVLRKLKSGQTITLSVGDDKMLKACYDYLQGFAEREQLALQLERKRHELIELGVPVEKSALLPKSRMLTAVAASHAHSAAPATSRRLSDTDKMDLIQCTIEEYQIIEGKLQTHAASDRRISLDDLTAVLLSLGVHNPQRRLVEQMVWEVDELTDSVICLDELLLAYRRNLDDKTGNEPSTFFRLLEFLLFDQAKRGFITEDDCMEILFVRYGASRLETELKFIFGSSRRSSGGDGTITFEGYCAAWLARDGKRLL